MDAVNRCRFCPFSKCLQKKRGQRDCYPLYATRLYFLTPVSPPVLTEAGPHPRRLKYISGAPDSAVGGASSINSCARGRSTLPSAGTKGRRTQTSSRLALNQILIHEYGGRMWKRSKINHRTPKPGVWEG